MHVPTRPLVAAICLLLMPTAAHGQEIASSLDQLRVLVRPGDSLTVTDAAGEALPGNVVELSSTCLVMQARGQRHEFSGDDISRITQPRHADLATGARWGFGIGAGFGLLTIASVAGHCRGCGAFVIANTVMFGGVGAGIGVAVAASITSPRLIYAKPGAPVKVAVAPLVGRARQGVLLSLRF